MSRRKSRRNTRVQLDSNRRLRFSHDRDFRSLKTALRVDLGTLYDATRVDPKAYSYNARIGNYNVGPMATPSKSPQLATGRFADPTVITQGSQVSTFKENRVCVSRAERREVMHATGNAGKSGQLPARWKQSSKTRCK